MEERAPAVLPEVTLAVWEAEDGRCEACKRPMDKRWARVARIDPHGEATVDNLQLLCVDCKARRIDPLWSSRLVLGGEVADRVLGALAPEQVAPATRWLSGQLQRYGVLLKGGKRVRFYWLPGVATFEVDFDEVGIGRVVKAEKLSPTPQVRMKPQARTRGLPRPDRVPQPVAKGAKARNPVGKGTEATAR
jgi:hypothetical protein